MYTNTHHVNVKKHKAKSINTRINKVKLKNTVSSFLSFRLSLVPHFVTTLNTNKTFGRKNCVTLNYELFEIIS